MNRWTQRVLPTFCERMCVGSHTTHRARYVLVSRLKSHCRERERKREHHEPLLLRFLVRKQCLVSRLMKQREISVFHRIRGLLPRTCFALHANPRESSFPNASCINFRFNPRIFPRWLVTTKIDWQTKRNIFYAMSLINFATIINWTTNC